VASCDKKRECLFYREKLPNLPPLTNEYKQEYCEGSPEQCARYMVMDKGINPPMDLFPYQQYDAKELLKSA